MAREIEDSEVIYRIVAARRELLRSLYPNAPQLPSSKVFVEDARGVVHVPTGRIVREKGSKSE